MTSSNKKCSIEPTTSFIQLATYGDFEKSLFHINNVPTRLYIQNIQNAEWCAPCIFELLCVEDDNPSEKVYSLSRAVDMFSKFCIKFPTEYLFKSCTIFYFDHNETKKVIDTVDEQSLDIFTNMYGYNCIERNEITTQILLPFYLLRNKSYLTMCALPYTNIKISVEFWNDIDHNKIHLYSQGISLNGASRAYSKNLKNVLYDQFVPIKRESIVSSGIIELKDIRLISQIYISFKKGEKFVKDIVKVLNIKIGESLIATKDLLEINHMFQGVKNGNHYMVSFSIDAEQGTNRDMFSRGQIGMIGLTSIMIEYEVKEPCEIIISMLTKNKLTYQGGSLEII